MISTLTQGFVGDGGGGAAAAVGSGEEVAGIGGIGAADGAGAGARAAGAVDGAGDTGTDWVGYVVGGVGGANYCVVGGDEAVLEQLHQQEGGLRRHWPSPNVSSCSS